MKILIPEKKIIIPPIKIQGIKTKLIPWIISNVTQFDGKWIEPFFGSGSVGINYGSKNAIIGDINTNIINLYKAFQEGSITSDLAKEFLYDNKKLLESSLNEGQDHYRYVRKRFNDNNNSLDFLFLSITSFNGLMRFNKHGKLNTAFCKEQFRLTDTYIKNKCNQINAVIKIIKDWQFLNKSFDKTILMANSEDFIYCDPPYFGRNTRYFESWSESNEEKLFNLLKDVKCKFILSTWHNDNNKVNPMIEKYWKLFNILKKEHIYKISQKVEHRKMVIEALICNF